MALNNNKELILFEAETQQKYTLILSSSDHLRAIEDVGFAQTLLTYAKTTTSTDDLDVVDTPSINYEVSDYEENASNLGSEPPEPELENKDDGASSSLDENTKTQYSWPNNQVVELINSMANHLDDFNHPKKRKHVYELITNDLVSMKFNVTPTMVLNKWKSLMKSYKKAKDNKTRTGRAPSRFQFFDQMDVILGTNPVNSGNHSINGDGALILDASRDPHELSVPEAGPELTQSNHNKENKSKQLPDKKLKRECKYGSEKRGIFKRTETP